MTRRRGDQALSSLESAFLDVTLEEGVARVTPADVQRVAQKYLNEDQSTTGWYVPIVPEAGRNAAAGS